MVFIRFFIFFSVSSISCFAQTGTIKDPYRHFTEAVAQIDASDTFNYTFHRILYDFNNDGKIDVALSSNDTWGNAGGEWTIYFMQSNKKYVVGNMESKAKGKTKITQNVFFDPESACIIKDKADTNIFIAYHRMSCCEGSIAYYKVYENKLQLYKLEYIKDSKTKKVASILYSLLKKGEKPKEQIGSLNCIRKNGSRNCWSKDAGN